MSIQSLTLLLLLPSTEWLVWFIFLRSIRRVAALQESISLISLIERMIKVFLFKAWGNLLVYLVVLFGTGIWLWLNAFTWQEVGMAPAFKLKDIVLGAACGISFFGALVLLAAFQKKLIPHRQFLWEVPSLYSHGYLRWILLCLGVPALELWRAASIKTLMNDSIPSGVAILLCSGVFALRFLPRGPYRVAYAAFEGMVFGGLYVWLGSLAAPLAARLVCELGMFAIFRGTVPAPPYFTLPAVANCPLCGRGFTREEVHFRESFACPWCHQLIGLPSWRMPLVKFLFFAEMVGFLGVFLEFPPDGVADSYMYYVYLLVVYVSAFLAAIGTVVLVDLLSLRRLSPGSPGIPSLGLTRSNREPDDRDQQPPA